MNRRIFAAVLLLVLLLCLSGCSSTADGRMRSWIGKNEQTVMALAAAAEKKAAIDPDRVWLISEDEKLIHQLFSSGVDMMTYDRKLALFTFSFPRTLASTLTLQSSLCYSVGGDMEPVLLSLGLEGYAVERQSEQVAVINGLGINGKGHATITELKRGWYEVKTDIPT